MRIDEGRSMAADLVANARSIGSELTQIEARAPLVVESYRERLLDRVNKLLSEAGAGGDKRHY